MRAILADELRVFVVAGALLLSALAGWRIGSQSPYAVAQAATPQSTYLSSSPIPSTLKTTQVWMREPFCIRAWWYDDRGQIVRLCSEYKGNDTPSPGASYKTDLPGPAALALVGKGDKWELAAVPMARPDMLPGPNLIPVSGPTLVTVLSQVTLSPLPPTSPAATATLEATAVSSPSPTVAGGATLTFTPSPPTPTQTPTATMTIPGCATSITWYIAGDPAMGGLGGEVGQVTRCDQCNRGCGTWLWGVSRQQMDEAVQAAKEHLTR